MKKRLAYIIWGMIAIGFLSCNKNKSTNSLFNTLTAEQTGLNFENKLTPTDDLSLLTYMYYYNGAGVAAGDFNKDGLVDLFFCANQTERKFYINKGKLKFEDVTTKAKIKPTDGWCTGASVIDINNDGLLDIYISKVGNYKNLKSKNELLVCTGFSKDSIPQFEDLAKEYGLDISAFGTQAAFLDYDIDGDLDLFLLNHSVNHDGNYAPRKLFENTYDSLVGHKFYRNDIVKLANGKTKSNFIEITKAVGIHSSKIGYGLGVVVSDINNDGYPDMYIGNDFHENDYLYINQRNGTFKDDVTSQIKHTSMFSMGVDAADINNDAKPEIISVDMLPYDPKIYKRSLAEDDYTIYNIKIDYGYNYQYARNNLQLNNGNNTFSEIGQYAGVYNSDWSWAPLWVDFNNDGLKDLFISNGIPKRMNDIDYINFISDEAIQNSFKTNGVTNKDLELIEKLPEIKLPNQFYLNEGNEKFKNISAEIKNTQPTFSNGSIYADLDNDGDIDIVTNNINDKVILYENNTANLDTANKFAVVNPMGSNTNINAIGSRLLIFSKEKILSYENYPVHGFLSSMQMPIHVGLKNVQIDSAIFIWNDNSCEKINIKSNEILNIHYKIGLPKFDYNILNIKNTDNTFTFEDITEESKLNYTHQENKFNEFDREPLLPFMNSTKGPAIAIADINNDGLEDVFVGASKTFHNAIFVQNTNGTFTKTTQLQMQKDSMWENVQATFGDVNGDNFVDLIIANGGNEFYGGDSHMLPILYLNDGKANFIRKEDAFPAIFQTQSCIALNDFNNDGIQDIFIGCNAEAWNYGNKVNSFLLLNDGNGKFKDVTRNYSKDLLQANMVTDAKWVDLNGDNKKDLITCSYWGTIDAYISNGNTFDIKILNSEKGFWNKIYVTDINNDGKQDIIAGNVGVNNKFNASIKEPIKMYYNDFDDNGKNECIVTYFLNGEEIPLSSKMEIEKRLPFLKKKYLFATNYAEASITDMFKKDKINSSIKNEVNNLQSAALINIGNNTFTTTALPKEAQWSSINAITNIGGNKSDLFIAGNFYENNIQIGRLDANYGLALNFKNNNFKVNPFNNFFLSGQVRHITPIKIKGGQAYIVVKNNEPLQILKLIK